MKKEVYSDQEMIAMIKKKAGLFKTFHGRLSHPLYHCKCGVDMGEFIAFVREKGMAKDIPDPEDKTTAANIADFLAQSGRDTEFLLKYIQKLEAALMIYRRILCDQKNASKSTE